MRRWALSNAVLLLSPYGFHKISLIEMMQIKRPTWQRFRQNQSIVKKFTTVEIQIFTKLESSPGQIIP